MKKLFIYLIIRMTTRHALNAVKIYDTIYNRKQPQKPKKKVLKENQYRQPVISNKKEEVIQSLNYLKSKFAVFYSQVMFIFIRYILTTFSFVVILFYF